MICMHPSVTHKDNYLEKRNWIILTVISLEDLKLQAYDLLHTGVAIAIQGL